MARQVRDSRLETKAARDRLRAGPKAYWTVIIPNQIMLGYRRGKASRPGKWLVRRYAGSNGRGGGKYRVTTIALADDHGDADASRILNYAQAQARAQDKIAPGAPITVRAAMASYIEYLRANGKATKDPEQRANAMILPALGDRLVEELTSDEIRKWFADYAERPGLIRAKANGERKERPPVEGDEAIRRRQSSANRLLTILKAALNLAFNEEKVQSDLAWKRVKPYKGVDGARVRFLSLDEATRLLNACEPDFRYLVRGALESGARYSELARLVVSDFSHNAGTLHVRKSKSGKARHIILTPEAVAFFRDLTAGRAGNALIFTADDGAPWKKSEQSRPMADAVAVAKIAPRISFHGLRHTYASHCVMGGVPLLVVAKNLGHATIAMVQKHYAHLAPSYEADAIHAGAPRFGAPEKTNVTPLPAKRRSATRARKS